MLRSYNTAISRSAARTFSGGLLGTIAVLSLTLSVAAAAHAYNRGTPPVLTDASLSSANSVTISWSKTEGKPVEILWETTNSGGGTYSLVDKVPGSAGSKGGFTYSSSAISCPAAGSWSIQLRNKWGSSNKITNACP